MSTLETETETDSSYEFSRGRNPTLRNVNDNVNANSSFQSFEPASDLGATAPDRNPNRNHAESIEEGAVESTTITRSRSRTSSSQEGLLLEQILFFLAGLGSSIGYIATLSSLVYFKVLFGANSFVYLNCAVFLPLLPISLAQAVWDSRFDLLYRTRVTFLVRGVLGYGFVMSGTVGMVAFARGHSDSNTIDDTIDENLGWVIFCAIQQGIGGGILFGQLNQLASFVGSLHQNSNNTTIGGTIDATDHSDDHENEALPKKFKATVSAGIQASALVVLVASIGSGFDTMNGAFFAPFLVKILQVEVLCFVASLWLLLARPRIQVSMLRRDTSMREFTVTATTSATTTSTTRCSSSSSELEDFHQLLSSPFESDANDDFDDDINDDGYARMRLPLLLETPSSTDGSNSNNHGSGSGEQTMLTLRELLYHSRLSCLAMALTLVPSFLVGSWFTRVQTDWMELAQILFYVRIGSDLTGRFATILVPPSSIECVVWTAGLRWIAVVLFFANASSKIKLPHLLNNSNNPQHTRDALSIVLVAFVAFCSGYLVTSCYQLAPKQLPGTPQARAANAARQSSLLTVAFSVSAIGGLVISFVLVAIGV